MSRVFPSHRRLSFATLTAVGFALLLAGAARAQQSDFSLQFGANAPNTPTAMHLYIVYRKPSDPNGKPSPIRHLVIAAPQGTRIDLGLPGCAASDQQIMASGPAACPADSQVGQGTLTALTGFGPPTDPFLTDVTIFNTGQGVVEIVRDHNTGATLTDDRIQIQGNVLTGNPPAIPGGPPDGQTAVRTIDFTFPLDQPLHHHPANLPDRTMDFAGELYLRRWQHPARVEQHAMYQPAKGGSAPEEASRLEEAPPKEKIETPPPRSPRSRPRRRQRLKASRDQLWSIATQNHIEDGRLRN